MLVLEKDTGQVTRLVNGVVTGTVLDLGVNRNSERGLLGIALHPDFPSARFATRLLVVFFAIDRRACSGHAPRKLGRENGTLDKSPAEG
jgi:hypothetical protein